MGSHDPTPILILIVCIFLVLVLLVALSFLFAPCAWFLYATSKSALAARRSLETQLGAFSIASLQCSVEADRPEVYAAIAEWFGDTAAFEDDPAAVWAHMLAVRDAEMELRIFY